MHWVLVVLVVEAVHYHHKIDGLLNNFEVVRQILTIPQTNYLNMDTYFSGSSYSAKLKPMHTLFFLKLIKTFMTFRQSSYHLPLICLAYLG